MFSMGQAQSCEQNKKNPFPHGTDILEEETTLKKMDK